MASRASGQDMWALTSTVIDAFCPELKAELMSGSPCKPLMDASARVAHMESSGTEADDGQGVHDDGQAVHVNQRQGVHVNETRNNETHNQTQTPGPQAVPAAYAPESHTAQSDDTTGVATTGSSEAHLQEGGKAAVSEASVVALLADAAGTLAHVATPIE